MKKITQLEKKQAPSSKEEVIEQYKNEVFDAHLNKNTAESERLADLTDLLEEITQVDIINQQSVEKLPSNIRYWNNSDLQDLYDTLADLIYGGIDTDELDAYQKTIESEQNATKKKIHQIQGEHLKPRVIDQYETLAYFNHTAKKIKEMQAEVGLEELDNALYFLFRMIINSKMLDMLERGENANINEEELERTVEMVKEVFKDFDYFPIHGFSIDDFKEVFLDDDKLIKNAILQEMIPRKLLEISYQRQNNKNVQVKYLEDQDIFDTKTLRRMIKLRTNIGAFTKIGYHSSFLRKLNTITERDMDGRVHVATHPGKLYIKDNNLLYLVDRPNQLHVNNKDHGWYTSGSALPVLGQLELGKWGQVFAFRQASGFET
ncbi:hypothetical protein ACFL21_02610 [Patescibacteria group bacterium]